MEREMLRSVQLVQLDIAKEIKRICDLNNISYFLDSGTLLGAVRHKGFIPWDDDMDLGMLRADYERFLIVARKEMNKKYKIVDWDTSKGYPRPFCKVIKVGSLYQEEGAKESDYENGIYVDIFPYDVYPNKKDIKQKNKINLYKAIIRNKCGIKTWVGNGRVDYLRLLKNVPILLLGTFVNLETAKREYTKAAKIHNGENSKYYFPQGVSGYGRWLIPHDCLEKYETIYFEDELFSVPSDSDAYLKHAYGDYMKLPPVEQRENRHKIIKVDLGG